ncbi:hypothetical protein M5225_004281 [Vibrio vulnificus]|uniref:hypothetical protein n=1 Tax=Vibrio metoecus TaxID=1481663 RepID=UPI000BA94D05|nr:hypothetical protein [Vibrio metoecus]EHZ2746755.1 hypothetical protein [Vibrio vulnificus]EHZ2903532.1 hypothetical protein [Vibrio vulnificus]EIA1338461.1 hypothetical protein [Vibrio vulnificus]EIA1774488.1 hypothetical protein [Vibrio vulnificus]EIU7597514.1 hypothetical protein [Vibrio vulnificus]
MTIRPLGTPAPEKEKLGNGVDSLHHTTKRLLTFQKKRFHNLDSFERMYNEFVIENDINTGQSPKHLLLAYKDLYEYHQKLVDEEKLISRMERNAQLRNTFFRGLTTLVIGFSVMFVYFIAAKLEIPMPLLRIGL